MPRNQSMGLYNVTDMYNNTVTMTNYSIVYDVTITHVIQGLEMKDGMNILGLVVFSCVFGKILNTIGDEGKPLVAFFVSLDKAVMVMVKWIM